VDVAYFVPFSVFIYFDGLFEGLYQTGNFYMWSVIREGIISFIDKHKKNKYNDIKEKCMKKVFIIIILSVLSINVHAQFNPDYIDWVFLDNMPLREYNEFAGNRVTISRELRQAISALTNTTRFDIEELFQISDVYGNETRDDDHFWEYVLRNYENIINARLSAGDVNMFIVPTMYFSDVDITAGYFLVSRYNGGNLNDSNSFRIFLYYYQIQWY